jgi:hypothetical protein
MDEKQMEPIAFRLFQGIIPSEWIATIMSKDEKRFGDNVFTSIFVKGKFCSIIVTSVFGSSEFSNTWLEKFS